MISPNQIGGRLGNRMFELAYIHAQFLRGVVPDPWVQHVEYFDEFRAQIMKLYGDNIGSRPEVSLHVRRTDYTTDAAFVSLWDTDYYERAMASFPGARFLVFSDDPAWCRRRWPHLHVLDKGDEINDLNTMASCSSNIIANSSYSWWAAYINPNPSKRVIYPARWHTDGVKRVTFPAGWEAL